MQSKLFSPVKLTPMKNLHWRTLTSSSPAEGEFSPEFKIINNKLTVFIIHFSECKGRSQKEKKKKKRGREGKTHNQRSFHLKKADYLLVPALNLKPEKKKCQEEQERRRQALQESYEPPAALQTSEPAQDPHCSSAPPGSDFAGCRGGLAEIPGSQWPLGVSSTSAGTPCSKWKVTVFYTKGGSWGFFSEDHPKMLHDELACASRYVKPGISLSKHELDAKKFLPRKQIRVMNYWEHSPRLKN